MTRNGCPRLRIEFVSGDDYNLRATGRSHEREPSGLQAAGGQLGAHHQPQVPVRPRPGLRGHRRGGRPQVPRLQRRRPGLRLHGPAERLLRRIRGGPPSTSILFKAIQSNSTDFNGFQRISTHVNACQSMSRRVNAFEHRRALIEVGDG